MIKASYSRCSVDYHDKSWEQNSLVTWGPCPFHTWQMFCVWVKDENIRPLFHWRSEGTTGPLYCRSPPHARKHGKCRCVHTGVSWIHRSAFYRYRLSHRFYIRQKTVHRLSRREKHSTSPSLSVQWHTTWIRTRLHTPLLGHLCHYLLLDGILVSIMCTSPREKSCTGSVRSVASTVFYKIVVPMHRPLRTANDNGSLDCSSTKYARKISA